MGPRVLINGIWYYFTQAEKAALEWAEALTCVEQTHAPDAAYEPLARHYDSKQVANITYAIAPGPLAVAHRDLIITLAVKYRLPLLYPYRYFTAAGGLISYGPDLVDQYRVVASYIDRILKGEKPADLPVQFPTKYMLVINLNTAKALGLTVPDKLLALADEVIE
jgi:hypothetical protein